MEFDSFIEDEYSDFIKDIRKVRDNINDIISLVNKKIDIISTYANKNEKFLNAFKSFSTVEQKFPEYGIKYTEKIYDHFNDIVDIIDNNERLLIEHLMYDIAKFEYKKPIKDFVDNCMNITKFYKFTIFCNIKMAILVSLIIYYIINVKIKEVYEKCSHESYHNYKMILCDCICSFGEIFIKNISFYSNDDKNSDIKSSIDETIKYVPYDDMTKNDMIDSLKVYKAKYAAIENEYEKIKDEYEKIKDEYEKYKKDIEEDDSVEVDVDYYVQLEPKYNKLKQMYNKLEPKYNDLEQKYNDLNKLLNKYKYDFQLSNDVIQTIKDYRSYSGVKRLEKEVENIYKKSYDYLMNIKKERGFDMITKLLNTFKLIERISKTQHADTQNIADIDYILKHNHYNNIKTKSELKDKDIEQMIFDYVMNNKIATRSK